MIFTSRAGLVVPKLLLFLFFFWWLFAFSPNHPIHPFSNFEKIELIQQIKQSHLVTIGFTKSWFTCGLRLAVIKLIVSPSTIDKMFEISVLFSNKMQV